MRKKRIMVIGPSKAGKTTIVNYINEYKGPLKRTADVIYGKHTIDIPSAYIENSWMYKHIIALAQDSSKVVVLVNQEKPEEVYSEGFAKLFNCPVIGVISKANINRENRGKCEKQLEKIGVLKPYFLLNSENLADIEKLKEYLLK